MAERSHARASMLLRSLGRIRVLRLPRGLLLLSALVVSSIGSCQLPSIKPPGL